MPPKQRKPTAIGRRLNEVRELVGATDLKSFYESLRGKRISGFPSYPAVCTYHGAPWRDPPTTYLARICERYPQVSMDWLVMDHGPRTRTAPGESQSDESTHIGELAEVVNGSQPFEGEPAASLWFTVAWEVLSWHSENYEEWTTGEATQVLSKLAALWCLPLEMVGRKPEQVLGPDLNAYLTAMFAATMAVLPRDRPGRERARSAILRHPFNEE